MSKGTVYPAESREFRDAKTGVRIRQVTAHPSIHHHPFFYIPAYDDRMQWLVFVSHRTGAAQIFVEERATGRLIQLTDRLDLNEWSLHPAHDGRFIYFTAGAGAWRVDTDTLKEELLAVFETDSIKAKGMVGAAMGTTTLSHDDRWWAVPVKFGNCSRFFVIDTQTGKASVILERDTIGHPEFHPNDANLLRYAGPHDRRIWVIQRDGRENRLAYRRNDAKKEWIVHETWMPTKREILTANWPHGVIGIDVDTGAVRTVTRFNAWHPMLSRDGTLMASDTKNPDIGLQLFDPNDGIGHARTLCFPEASNAGEHWNTDHCPYDDGPVRVYAPQHTHPHPSFALDKSRVVFTSDQSGHAQIYEAFL
ncbi:MAG: hypothetical protein FJ403_06005 [Verrucomicrobia bacterium]|nr:hypothetical protein [Verrucomicrobiota bacterium]